MKTTIAIVLGYDNSLTTTDLEAIKLLKQTNNYQFSLFYYLPKIPPEFYILSSVRQMMQEYRDQAEQALKSISNELDITLPQINHQIDFDNIFISGSSDVFYRVKTQHHHDVVLTGNQAKVKVLFFDLLINWLKSRITGKPIQELDIFEPATFMSKIPQLQGLYPFAISPPKKLNKMVLMSKKQSIPANGSGTSPQTLTKARPVGSELQEDLKEKFAVNFL